MFSIQNQTNYTWVASSSDARALLLPGSTSQRIAATWFSATSFSMNVNVAGQHQLALYAVDWDNGGRVETIKVVDAANSSNVLNTVTLSGFSGGVYLAWNITGSVNIIVSASTGNAVVSGVFFGGATSGGSSGAPVLNITKSHTGNFTQGQQNATYTVTVSNAGTAAATGTVTVTETIPTGLALVSMSGTGWTCPANSASCTRSDGLGAGSSYLPITVTVNVAANATSPQLNQVSVSGGGSATAAATDSTTITTASSSGASASFLFKDTTTQGNWQGVYGSAGEMIVNGPQNAPSANYGNFNSVQSATQYTWAANTSDVRALETGSGVSGSRTAATWFGSSFTFDVTLNGPEKFELYALDWDSGGRVETVTIADATTNAVLDTRTISIEGFSQGVYTRLGILPAMRENHGSRS